MKKTLCITLPVEMVEKLVNVAKTSKRTISSQIEAFIEEELKKVKAYEKKKNK